jgi:hypothetical protein
LVASSGHTLVIGTSGGEALTKQVRRVRHRAPAGTRVSSTVCDTTAAPTTNFDRSPSPAGSPRPGGKRPVEAGGRRCCSARRRSAATCLPGSRRTGPAVGLRAEYVMLPGSTPSRKPWPKIGHTDSRGTEIQR